MSPLLESSACELVSFRDYAQMKGQATAHMRIINNVVRGGHPGKKGLRSGPGRVHGFDPRVQVGSGSGPGRVRSTETRQPKAMGVDPGSPFNLNEQKGEEKN